MTGSTTGPVPSPHVVRARRSLPNGRAVVGAFLVTAAAVGAFLVARPGDAGPRTRYLVLAADIEAGQTLDAAQVVPEALDLGLTVAASAIAGSADVEGAVALRDLGAGTLLTTDDLGAPSIVDGEPIGDVHELTIPVPLDRSPAVLLPGDRVTVLATAHRDGGVVTELAAEDAVVLRFDTGTDRIGGAAQGVLTLAVDDPTAVVALAHLAQEGDMTVVRTTRAIDDRYPSSSADVAADPSDGGS